ncbi:unnamed protein product [Dibothriocephalus latus]|uniref:Uncharacterized protein n=1 Tax=Dibothriocephalus latus TaxID=60516 RepID=A0A3P7RQD4_DIBLA|nr:unnamed protein product [Dibothriocephalus latus]
MEEPSPPPPPEIHFPAAIPESETLSPSSDMQSAVVDDSLSSDSRLHRLTAVFCRVVTNPVWLGTTITTVTEQTIVSAFLTFAAKYIQALFRVPAHIASIHTAGCACGGLKWGKRWECVVVDVVLQPRTIATSC